LQAELQPTAFRREQSSRHETFIKWQRPIVSASNDMEHKDIVDALLTISVGIH
jgi:hypothetical protein